MRLRDRETLARIFRHYGEVEAPRLDSPVYTALALGIAEDEALLALAAEVDAAQPPPNVLWAAVQWMLLESRESGAVSDPLASFYPAVSGAAIPVDDPFAAFRAFCLDRAEALRPILRTGRTQTCVVQRCAALLPALGWCLERQRSISNPYAVGHDGRVALLEIGPSAGLNLRLDLYRYDYGDGLVWGRAEASPVIRTQTRGETGPPLPKGLEVVARRGIDLHLVDLGDPAAVRWQRALVWPEHVDRLRSMEAAFEQAGRVPVELVEGDATRELEAQIEQLPDDASAFVYATHVLYQIPPEGRAAISQQIARASQARSIDLVTMESSGEGDSRLAWQGFARGERVGREELARCDSHGRWIGWGIG